MEKYFFLTSLTCIIIIAVVLRLWQFGNVPPSPDWDEAALGYNAYSILLTGKDEYGQTLPIVLRSFDDYKPALYTYLIIPFIPILGLTVQAVRVPGILIGILMVVATCFLIKKLVNDSENEQIRTYVPLTSAFLLAISPWHIQFSRIAFESQVGTAFNVFMVVFFLKGMKKPYFLFLSVVFASLAMYVYQSEKVFTPLLFLSLILIFRKELFRLPKKILIYSFLLGILISFPLFHYTLTNKQALARAQGVSVFSDTTQLLKDNAIRNDVDKKNNDIVGIFLDNRRLLFIKSVAAGYLSHFDLNWLFISGDIARHHAPYMGLLYLWEMPFLFLGVVYLLFSKDFNRKTKLLFFTWILLAPIPASVTSGVPHAVRTMNFLPVLQVITGIGTVMFFRKIFTTSTHYPSFILKWGATGVFILFFVLNFCYFLNQYFVQQNYLNSKEWQYGYKEAVESVKSLSPNYKKVVVTNKGPLDQSYMFFLFYLAYPPSTYQKESMLASGGFRENHIFDKYEFRPIVWETEKKSSDILYVGRPEDFSGDAQIIKTIYYIDGLPAIRIVKG